MDRKNSLHILGDELDELSVLMGRIAIAVRTYLPVRAVTCALGL